MLMHERVAMKRECQNRSQSRILRGWIKIKATVTKWDEARKESRGRMLIAEVNYSSIFLTCPFPLAQKLAAFHRHL
jgi:hypothetical protein